MESPSHPRRARMFIPVWSSAALALISAREIIQSWLISGLKYGSCCSIVAQNGWRIRSAVSRPTASSSRLVASGSRLESFTSSSNLGSPSVHHGSSVFLADIFNRRKLPHAVTCLQIIYPRMVFAEKILEKPDRFVFKAIRKLGVIPGFVSGTVFPALALLVYICCMITLKVFLYFFSGCDSIITLMLTQSCSTIWMIIVSSGVSQKKKKNASFSFEDADHLTPRLINH